MFEKYSGTSLTASPKEYKEQKSSKMRQSLVMTDQPQIYGSNNQNGSQGVGALMNLEESTIRGSDMNSVINKIDVSSLNPKDNQSLESQEKDKINVTDYEAI